MLPLARPVAAQKKMAARRFLCDERTLVVWTASIDDRWTYDAELWVQVSDGNIPHMFSETESEHCEESDRSFEEKRLKLNELSSTNATIMTLHI